jgi:Outer membrane lipoprotein carrier protein LolA
LVCTAALSDGVVSRIAAQLSNNSPLTIGAFTQEKRLKFLHKPLVSRGEFIFAKERGVLWKTQEPMASVLYVGEGGMLADGARQSLPADVGRIFRALLGGDFNALAQDFSMQGEDKAGKWQVRLMPINPEVQKMIQTVTIDGDREITAITLTETGGNVTSIAFSAISHPSQLSPRQSDEFARFQP